MGRILLGRIFSQAFQECNILLRNILRDVRRLTGPSETENVGDSIDQNCGFSASGTRKKQQRAFCGPAAYRLTEKTVRKYSAALRQEIGLAIDLS